MRILHVVRSLDAAQGGVPAAAAHMAHALGAEGHDVTIATTVLHRSSKEIEQLATTIGERVDIKSFVRSGLPYDHSVQLARWCRRVMDDFELVEAHGVFDYPCWKAAELARKSKCRLLIHAHGSLDPFDLRKHHRLKTLVGPTLIRRNLDYASAIMVTTAREGAALEAFGSRTTIRPIPLPYRPNGRVGNAERFRQKHNIPDGPLLLFFGRLDYKKGLKHLVDARELLGRDEIGLTFVLGGDNSSAYAQALIADVDARGLKAEVIFPGHLDEADKADGLAAATAFALVSDNENYGLVLVEAARAGLPMLLSDQVYVEAELRAAGAALVVSRDGAAIAAALRVLMNDPAQLHRMSVSARRAAHDLYDWQTVASAQSEFRALLRRGGRVG